MQPITRNTLFYGDNLDILRQHIPTESVDLIYLDPPFNSNRDYSVLFADESGLDSEAQITAFEDTWHWGPTAKRTYEDLALEGPERIRKAIPALHDMLGSNQMMVYLVMMTARLLELHRVLKPIGSLYLHCDPTASHFLKIMLDAIFGPENFVNEIIWQRTSSHNDSRKWGAVHDVILFYSKSDAFTWNDVFTDYAPDYVENFYRHEDERGVYRLDHIIRSATMGPRPNLAYEYKGYTPQWGWRVVREKLEVLDAEDRLYWSKTGRPYLKRYLAEQKGVAIKSVITDIKPVGAQAAERLNYPTQKPLALLERIMQASSNPGDVVLDPFCGCGTAVAAAHNLERRWIGIDITHLAIALQTSRLYDMVGIKPREDYDIIGQPQDLAGARCLATADKASGRYEFQDWANSLVQAQPRGGMLGKSQRGKDRGVDGVITFIDEVNGGKPKWVIVQIKSGKVSSRDVRDLVGVIDREGAVIGLLLTLERPTRDMRSEAVDAGFYHSPGWNRDYPRIQILTIEELLEGKQPEMPPQRMTFKQAPRVENNSNDQQRLL